MKAKWFNGIRFKFLLLFTASIILALICIIIFESILFQQIGLKPNEIDDVEKRYSFFYMVLFFILTSLFYYLSTKKIISRIEDIDKSVSHIKEGNLDIHIQMSSQDELGNLAKNINTMVKSLKEFNEREKQVEKLKTEMISNISHDLRTPVTSLLGYIELLKMCSENGKDIAGNQNYIDILQRKGYELQHLVNELLDYCSIDFRQVKVNKETVEVKAIVQQVIIDFIPELEEAEMSFTIEAISRKIYIDADVGLVLRLLQNIISNSIHYGKAGKKITVQIFTEKENVIIKIINYGKEISSEDKPYIFERFYRAEKSRGTHTGGKGMGLAIAKSIAELHKGTISVTSNPTETAFITMLPKSKKTD